ncbi:hypothetical protein FE782_03745 [Paenibacillus antri]|uniref:Uncharacterized protein n=1 Tax=Paenibacillus antri TaxID=2582848 RepID=A0A5R9GN07_9BACL|nr:hypothetical protein [Paenibacillus antri]TLS53395.1 hypothetical protein FE782_03745 [Paenibacillus antri]
MPKVSDEEWRLLDRAADITGIISRLIEDKEPGRYRFEWTYKHERKEIADICRQFQASEVPELQTVGLRIDRLVDAVIDTDRVFNTYEPTSRTARKQRQAIAEEGEKLEAAIAKFRNTVEKEAV